LRGGYGEERYEKEEMQARVRQAFKRLGDETSSEQHQSDGLAPGTKWIDIDAGKERDAVAEEMWASVQCLVRSGLTRPVGKLWQSRTL
jgi:dTMP kinase